MTGLVNAAQLARFQAVAAGAMDVSGIQVKRPANTPDGFGTYTVALTTVATVTGGWAKPTAGVMQAYAGLIGSQAVWVVRLPYGTDCKAGDHIIMPTGEDLTVQADLSESSYSTCKRVLASKVR